MTESHIENKIQTHKQLTVKRNTNMKIKKMCEFLG